MQLIVAMPMFVIRNLIPSLSRLSLDRPRIGSGRSDRSLSIEFDEALLAESPTPALVKVCVGFVAISRLEAPCASGETEGVLFIEELFVRNESRQKGVGRCLLTHAMRMENSSTFPKVALVVRLRAPQQKAALLLYNKLGFVQVESRSLRDYYSKEDAGVDPKVGVEGYMQASISEGMCALQDPDAKGHAYVKGSDVFLDAKPMHPQAFIRTYPSVVQLANRHHRAKEGDRGNIKSILEPANVGVYGAYSYQ